MKTNQPAIPAEGAQAREIPPLPGGGSWTFDESAWQWKSNDPVPVPDPVAALNVVANKTEQEQA